MSIPTVAELNQWPEGVPRVPAERPPRIAARECRAYLIGWRRRKANEAWPEDADERIGYDDAQRALREGRDIRREEP